MAEKGLNRQEFVALAKRLMDGDEDGFVKSGMYWHFGLQEINYMADILYGTGENTDERHSG